MCVKAFACKYSHSHVEQLPTEHDWGWWMAPPHASPQTPQKPMKMTAKKTEVPHASVRLNLDRLANSALLASD